MNTHQIYRKDVKHLPKHSRKWFCLICLIIPLLASSCNKMEISKVIPIRQENSKYAAEGQEPEQEPTYVGTVSEGKYAYGQLNTEEKKVYDEIYAAITRFETDAKVSTLDEGIIEKAYEFVMYDYPEFFWAEGYVLTKYTLGDRLYKISFSPQFTCTQDEMVAKQEAIAQKVDEILAGISPETSDYEKTKYVYEYLASNIQYVVDSPDNQNISSVFLGGATVCSGFAKATQYLLGRLQIPCITVSGTGGGEPHAWNLAQLDGEYYALDVTWATTSFSGRGDTYPYINYNYLCVTTQELQKTHQPEGDLILPECAATKNNYFVQEGLYFEEPDTDAIGQALSRELAAKGHVSLKFASGEAYLAAKEYFIENKHVFDYYSGGQSILWADDPDYNIISIFY